MELPKDLLTLYNHWEKHTNYNLPSTSNNFESKLFADIIRFANERMSILEKKYTGMNPPLSTDPILNKYKFCNIYRELDRQTIEFHKLLKPYSQDLSLWFLNMLFCRFICNTETISKVGLLSFDKAHNQKVFEKLMNLPRPKYGVAYIFPISTIQRSEYNTREKFFCYYLPSIIKNVTDEIEEFENISVSEALERALPILKFNFRFHFTEAFIDLAYQYPSKIDLFKIFPIGPGSIPTMKKLNSDKQPVDVNLDLVLTKPKNFNYLRIDGKNIQLSAENWEGIGCEFRKYSNLKNGSGRKRIYRKAIG
jgi:hypothetical protein